MCAAEAEMTVKTSDDGTVMSLTLLPRLALVSRMLDVMAEFLSRNDVDRSLARRVLLTAEELVANAISHGRAPEDRASIALDLRRGRDRVVTKITYDGEAFDPTKPLPRPADLYERPGGFGLRLVRSAVDELSYRRRGRSNIVLASHSARR